MYIPVTIPIFEFQAQPASMTIEFKLKANGVLNREP